MSDQKIDKYAEDLATIKSILMDVEIRPFLEPWAFISWGGSVLLGTILHFILRNYVGLTLEQISLYMWVPVFVLGIFFEVVAWLRRMSREAMPLFPKPVVKLFIALTGIIAALGFMIAIVSKHTGISYVPHFILASFGICLIYYGQIALMSYFAYGYFLIICAFLFYLIPLTPDQSYFVAGLLLSGTFFGAAISTYRSEKRAHD